MWAGQLTLRRSARHAGHVIPVAAEVGPHFFVLISHQGFISELFTTCSSYEDDLPQPSQRDLDFMIVCKCCCVFQVDVAWFYRNCLTDTCNCNRGGDCECLCTSIAAYAHKCCQQGVTIHWRSPSVCREYAHMHTNSSSFDCSSADIRYYSNILHIFCVMENFHFQPMTVNTTIKVSEPPLPPSCHFIPTELVITLTSCLAVSFSRRTR